MAGPQPCSGKGQGSASACSQADPLGASLGTMVGSGASLAPCACRAILPQEHPWGSSVIRHHGEIGDQPASVCVCGAATPREHPWGLWGDGGPACLHPLAVSCLAWGAWRQLSHGTPAACHAWGLHSETPFPLMPVVTFVTVAAGRAGGGSLPVRSAPVPWHASSALSGASSVFLRIISPVPGSPASSPEPGFSSYEES